jgi:hypothetical protein
MEPAEGPPTTVPAGSNQTIAGRERPPPLPDRCGLEHLDLRLLTSQSESGWLSLEHARSSGLADPATRRKVLMGAWILRHRVLFLGLLVVGSAALRISLTRGFAAPWIVPDEVIYGLLGESVWSSGEFSMRGAPVPYFSLLYPLLIGLPLHVHDLSLGITLVQCVQALVMSLVAIPVYLWARRALSHGWALTAAALALTPPALLYAGLLMSEALYYPVIALALFALAKALEEPTTLHYGLFLTATTVACSVRLQALVLVPAFVLALVLEAMFARSWTAIRRPTWALTSVGVVGSIFLALTVVGRQASFESLLGAYAVVGEARPSLWQITVAALQNSADVGVVVLGVPLLATLGLALAAARRGESDRASRALLSTTVAYTVCVVVEVSVFAATYVDHVAERYLITTAPALLICFCLWLQRDAPKSRGLVVCSLVLVGLVATVPVEAIASPYAAHDAFTALPLAHVSSSPLARAVLIGLTLVAAISTVLLAGRALRLAPVVIGASLLLLSVASAHQIAVLSRAEQNAAFGATQPNWIDEAGATHTIILNTGDQPWPALTRTVFWNRSVTSVVRSERASGYGPLQQPTTTVDLEGRIRDHHGQTIEAPYVVAPSTVSLTGTRVAETAPTDASHGLSLWHTRRTPITLATRTDGVTPNGDFTGTARIVIYACKRGHLSVVLLGKSGAPITISVDGKPQPPIPLQPGTVWYGQIPTPPHADGSAACVIRLHAAGLTGSTRIVFAPN